MTELRRKVLTRVGRLMERWDRTNRSTVIVELPESDRLAHIEGLLRALRAAVEAEGGSRQVLLLAIAGQAVSWLESIEDDEQAAQVLRLVEVMEASA